MISILYAWCVISFIYTIIWFKVDHKIPNEQNSTKDYLLLTILTCLPSLIVAIFFFVMWNKLEKLFKNIKNENYGN